jgi:hypothetical protein
MVLAITSPSPVHLWMGEGGRRPDEGSFFAWPRALIRPVGHLLPCEGAQEKAIKSAWVHYV